MGREWRYERLLQLYILVTKAFSGCQPSIEIILSKPAVGLGRGLLQPQKMHCKTFAKLFSLREIFRYTVSNNSTYAVCSFTDHVRTYLVLDQCCWTYQMLNTFASKVQYLVY